MRCRVWMMLATALLAVSACGSPEQPPVKSAPQAVTTPAPAPAAAPVPAAPPASIAEPPPAPQPSTAPTPPITPAAPSKPAAAVTAAAKATVATPPPAPKQPVVPSAEIPDVVTLAASQGQVTLSHLAHAKSFPCASCHLDGPPGKISLTRDTAHDLCRDCHKAKGAGPTTCTGCHKK